MLVPCSYDARARGLCGLAPHDQNKTVVGLKKGVFSVPGPYQVPSNALPDPFLPSPEATLVRGGMEEKAEMRG